MENRPSLPSTLAMASGSGASLNVTVSVDSSPVTSTDFPPRISTRFWRTFLASSSLFCARADNSTVTVLVFCAIATMPKVQRTHTAATQTINLFVMIPNLIPSRYSVIPSIVSEDTYRPNTTIPGLQAPGCRRSGVGCGVWGVGRRNGSYGTDGSNGGRDRIFRLLTPMLPVLLILLILPTPDPRHPTPETRLFREASA